MSRLRYLAAQGLADLIAPLVAPFSGRATAPQQPPTEVSQYPEVVVLPLRNQIEWWYETEVLDDEGDVVLDSSGDPVFCLGSYQGTVRLQVAARTEHAREDLQDATVAAFNLVDGQPGVAVVDVVNPVVAGRTVPATMRSTFTLRGDEWREEMVFSERRWAWMDCDFEGAVLVSRPIEENPLTAQIRICLTEDIETDITGLTPEQASAALQPLDEVVVT